MKILICDPVADEAIEQFKAAGMQVDALEQIGLSRLAEIIGQYEGLMLGRQTVLSRDILEKATSLEIIGEVGKDTGNLDLAAATRQGILVVNTSEGVSVSIAEYTMYMLLTLGRRQRPDIIVGMMGTELKGKTLGIIGLGNVGGQVARRARAFEMRVVCYDPSVSRARAMMHEAEVLDLIDLLIVSDFITIHAPLNEQTRSMIDQEAISLMKQGVSIINTAQPEICEPDALYAGLKSGQIKNIAWDFPSRSEEIRQKFADFPQVILTEDQAAATNEAQMGTALEIVAEMLNVWQEGTSSNAINIPLIKESQQKLFRPFVDLAITLSDFIGQIVPDQIKAVTINYQGEIAQYQTEPLDRLILQHLFRQNTEDKMNYVNAAVWADEHGIEVKSCKQSESSDYQNYIRIELQTKTQNKVVAGTVLDGGELKIVQIDHFTLSVKPESHFLLVPHQNKPGMIGSVGSVLGRNNINISGMVVGAQLQDNRDVAIMVMTVDHPVTEAVITLLEKIPGVFDIHYVRLQDDQSAKTLIKLASL